MKRTWVGIAILSMCFWLALTLTVHLRFWKPFDWETLLALQSTLPRSLDLPFSLFSWFGSAEVTTLTVLAIVFFALPAQRLPLVLTFGLATLIELVGKTVINQPTTPYYLLRYVPLLPMLSTKVNPGFSFPSGHALRTTFLAIILASLIATRNLQRPLKITLYALLISIEFVMLVSRVYLADHWLTDVIGGALLGGAFALLSLNWEIHLPRLFRRNYF